MVSEISKEIYKCYNNGQTVRDEKTSKLLLTLHDKVAHVLHIRNLINYVEKGLVLTDTHRCIKPSQSDWLKEWI